MALPPHMGDAIIEFLVDAGDRFKNFVIDIEKLWADALRSETETVALRNQVTALAEHVTALADQAATDSVRSKSEADALRLQVTAQAEQAVAVANGAAASIPEGPSRPCPLTRSSFTISQTLFTISIPLSLADH